MDKVRTREKQISEMEGIACDAGYNECTARDCAEEFLKEAELRERTTVLDEVKKLVEAQLSVLVDQLEGDHEKFLAVCSREHIINGIQEIQQYGKKF